MSPSTHSPARPGTANAPRLRRAAAALAGSRPKALHRVASTRWDGLDTTTSAPTHGAYVAVLALNDRGHTIGRSPAVKVSD